MAPADPGAPGTADGIRESVELIGTDDGPMKTLVTQPADEGPHHAVVMVQHIGGLSETMRIVARQVAKHGYRCVLPSLYHRLGEIVIDPTGGGQAVEEIRRIAVASVTPMTLMTDVDAVLAWLDDQPDAHVGGRAIIGFGGGASLAFLAAAVRPKIFRALISILGVRFIRPDEPWSPHLLVDQLSASAYFGFASEDEIIPLSDVERLRGVLDTAGIDHEIQVHPGVRHGYFFSDRDSYSASAAQEDWIRIRTLLDRKLEAG